MKTLQVLFGFLLIGFCLASIAPTLDILKPAIQSAQDLFEAEDFVQFGKTYNKSYDTEQEVIKRFAIFQSNLAKYAKQNELSNKVGGAKWGVTVMSDLTPEEFSKYLMHSMPAIPKDKMYPNYLEPNTSMRSGAPSSFDWRNHPGAVTGVYNQGQCGSCWAFSATENHESRYALQHGQGAQSMSVQQIIDCDAPNQYACNGGWPYQAWEYIQSQGGQDTWGCYPYVGYYEGSCHWNGGCNAGSLVSWSWIFPHNEGAMLNWLYGNAPISICLDASQWSGYNGGVVMSSECAQQTDHCVLAVGYNVAANPPYWIVRNSWGTGWGPYGGYILLQYNANTCNMASYPASCHTVNGQ